VYYHVSNFIRLRAKTDGQAEDGIQVSAYVSKYRSYNLLRSCHLIREGVVGLNCNWNPSLCDVVELVSVLKSFIFFLCILTGQN